MIDQIKEFFRNKIEVPEKSATQSIQLATAALLIEVMAIDHKLEDEEEQEIRRRLKTLFDLPDDEVSSLFELADAERSDATSLYQFTSLVNRHFNSDEKIQLVLNLWRVAFADGHLDKYEEGIIRRISDLIYVSHSDFIRTKLHAKKSGSNSN